MRVLVAAVGKAGPGPERDLIERYAERARHQGRALGITRLDIVELAESRAKSVVERRAAEADAIIGLLPPSAVLVALDERGGNMSSAELSATFDRWRMGGAPTAAFAIGGPDGHGPAVLARAQLTISFGAATWPHLLVRAMLLEQIFRSLTILSGHPYHRA